MSWLHVGFAVLTAELTMFSMILATIPSFKNRLLGRFWAFGFTQ